MIQCDEVFDILTRGPFPTGAPSDGIVELHLAQCESCRQLAEALRPALELFQEAVTPEESRTLPSYWGETGSNLAPWLSGKSSGGGGRVAQRAPTLRRRIRSPLTLPRWSLPPSARVAAAVVLGMALAGLLRRLGSDEIDSAARPAVAAMGRARWQAAEDPRHWLLKTKLGAACKAEVEGAMLETMAGMSHGDEAPFRLACCTACHKVVQAANTPGHAATASVVSACTVCHHVPQVE
ncbi:MAG TPA: hypothetical protein VHC19_17830 [Pirellulales bacterium]|jgi:hypothetical protein|nr:hypothetical protein [Pirellulales bacterium]